MYNILRIDALHRNVVLKRGIQQYFVSLSIVFLAITDYSSCVDITALDIWRFLRDTTIF